MEEGRADPEDVLRLAIQHKSLRAGRQCGCLSIGLGGAGVTAASRLASTVPYMAGQPGKQEEPLGSQRQLLLTAAS